MSKIIDKLYQGTWDEASNLEYQNSNQISHVCVCAPAVGHFYPQKFTYKSIPLLDFETFDPYPLIDSTVEWIKDSMDNGTGVFVHDYMNDGRATMMIIGYIMKFLSLNVPMALKMVLKMRPEARCDKNNILAINK